MSHDTLSDVLRSVRLRSALFFYVSCRGKWAAEAPPSREIAGAVLPGADHVIEYHVVTEGECWAAIVGQSPLKLRRGDIIMLPQGDPHVMSYAPGMRANPYTSAYYEMKHHYRPFLVTYDSDGQPQVIPRTGNQAASDDDASTKLVCGFIGCDMRPFNPLIATLPRLLHLSGDRGDAWSEQFVRLAATESTSRRPGSEALLERLSEMMFVDAVRRHADSMPEQSTGWLAALRDRFVGRAMALMHEKPSEPWTIDELGKQVGLSRSALHERFVELIGQPPMQYLTNWRMQLASRLLRDTQSSVAAIALEVGYDSEAAFARAFKRLVGTPPATWRRMQGELSGASEEDAGAASTAHLGTGAE
ncbi:AraC family transcriptional regulator [Sulfurifustis variabilis]|uniref:AraC family transcriptional regulator n=1 Tax=Sulfurifustis variabilis TaxID=1675686 RepID=A0A1B4VDE8_9GAMM|nr:AraC family transcriptional regulator [Sulfurifustis variabilis]BAU47847.1 AraC family transcriptional regulator [Sulfurifustis variabilis]